jgi:hypothetical protein
MVEDEIEVKLLISEADIDDERLDQFISVLISDLRDRDEIFSVSRLKTGDIPEAAMGSFDDWIGLLLKVLPSKIEQSLDAVIEKFQRITAKIEVSIDGFKGSIRVPISPEELQNFLKLTGKLIETKNSGKK